MSTFLLGGSETGSLSLHLAMANRHGLIAGATGTGKTVSLQVLAEGFSRAGVPVFLADVKGDLSGLVQAARPSEKIQARLARIGQSAYQPQGFPCLFWDLHGQSGHPLRATLSEIGPLLLSHILELNEVQEGVIYSAFRLADEEGLLLLDLKDLQALLTFMGEESRQLSIRYGNITRPTIGSIQRRLLVLEEQGAAHFLAEPSLRLADLMHCDAQGKGVISILQAAAIFSRAPRLYSSFLLWMLAELFETLPELGDVDKPRLVFFFDEAHLLFSAAPRSVVERIEQVVRLIRSRGVGIYFVSQSPADLPETILGQLGLRIQHALRAFTPKDQQALKVAADTFRPNPKLNTERAIAELGTGEALVSLLDPSGAPTPVERVWICPPASQIGPVPAAVIEGLVCGSPLKGIYDQALDRHSAYEMLQQRCSSQGGEARAPSFAPEPARPEPATPDQDAAGQARTGLRERRRQAELEDAEQGRYHSRRQEQEPERARPAQARPAQARPAQAGPRGRSGREGLGEAFLKSAVRSFGSQVGGKLMRGLLGSLLK
jgi:DNA helicase HerA-like ATPase